MKIFNTSISHVLLALTLGLAAGATLAQDVKIAAVNVDRIIRDSASAKAAEAKLIQEFSRREREIETLGNQLRAASEKFDREAPTLSDSQRLARQRQVMELDRDFQRKRQAYQEDLNLRKNEEVQLLLDRIDRVIRQIANDEKYDFILQEAAFINAKHDITDKVIQVLDNSR